MVSGIESFKAWFHGFSDQYAVIGGTACDLLFSEAGLDFRATKDIDMVLSVLLTPETRITLPDSVYTDLMCFLTEMKAEDVDLNQFGIRNQNAIDIINKISAGYIKPKSY